MRGQEVAQVPALGPQRVAAHSCQRGSRRPCSGAAGTAKELHAPNSSTNRKCKQSQSFTGTSQQLRLIRKHNPGYAQRPQETLQHPSDVSPVGTSFQAPRWASTPPSTLRLGVAPLSGPCLCQLGTPLSPSPLTASAAPQGGGLDLPQCDEARPPQLGDTTMRTLARGPPGSRARFCLRLSPGTDPANRPLRVATVTGGVN